MFVGKNPNFFTGICTVDDTMVTRFRELGAIVMGLTIMVEGGVSPLGYNSHFHVSTIIYFCYLYVM